MLTNLSNDGDCLETSDRVLDGKKKQQQKKKKKKKTHTVQFAKL